MRAIDLFAGCGGASIGLHRAGIEVVAAYERDPDACASHRAIAPGAVVEVDLSAVETLPQVDLWWASPPCQPFSVAGKRAGPRDDRDGYPHLLRLLGAGPKPAWLVIENVAGLLYHSRKGGCSPLFPRPDACPGCYLAAIESALRELFPWVEFRVLDCASYGVPQHRRRLIMVCGPEAIEWPKATHGPGTGTPWVTMGQALGLGHLVGADTNPHGPGRGHERTHRVITGEPAPTVTSEQIGNAGPWVVEAGEQVVRPAWWHRASPADEPSRTVGSRGNASMLLDRPSPTVCATEEKGAGIRSTHYVRGEHARPDMTRASCALLIATGRRRLTIAECAILQDLPTSGYVGNKSSQYRQIGNACPGRLVEVVARAVLGEKVTP